MDTGDYSVEDEQRIQTSSGRKRAVNKYKLNAYGQPCPTPVPRWTPDEVQRLTQSIQDTCAGRQIDPTLLFQQKRERSDLWYEVAQAFPHRTVEMVYKKAYRQAQQATRSNTGKWTEDECQRLAALVVRHGTRWAHISRLMDRTADSCADKYREALSAPSRRQGRFDEEEQEKLQQLVAPYENDTSIPFTVVSKKMGNRSRLSCYRKWQKLQQQRRQPRRSQPLLAELDRLYLEADRATVTTNGLLKALQCEQHDPEPFPKETRRMLRRHIQGLVTGQITPQPPPTAAAAAAAAAHQSPTQQPQQQQQPQRRRKREAAPSSGPATAKKRREDVSPDAAPTSRDSGGYAPVPSPQRSGGGSRRRDTVTDKSAGGSIPGDDVDDDDDVGGDDARASVTIQDVSDAMVRILQSAPERRLKKKSLRRAVKKHSRRVGWSYSDAKMLMKIHLKEKTRFLLSEGGIVTLADRESE